MKRNYEGNLISSIERSEILHNNDQPFRRLLDKYQDAREKKDSILCVGLDPAVKGFRDKEFIPDIYMADEDIGNAILEFCINIIEQTSDYACAIKPNSQYLLFAMNLNQLRKLNEEAHNEGLISILDHKLSDIGSTNSSAFYWISEAGFDAVTFSPFAGNIEEATNDAHKYNLGLISLALMSNPESSWIQKDAKFNGIPLYREIARLARLSGTDGLVVGATDNVTESDIKKIREISGNDMLFLCPGIGAQGGDAEKLINSAGENLMINVGRAIIYEKNPGDRAKEFCELFNGFRKE